MIALSQGDKIRGDASAATQVDYTIHGFMDNVPKLLANGQLAAAIADMVTAGAADMVVSSIVLVNTSIGVTVNLYILPSGGTARRIIPLNYALATGHSLHTDGKTLVNTAP